MSDPRAAAADEARARLDAKTKPRGSLGRLEDLAVRIAEIGSLTADGIPYLRPEIAGRYRDDSSESSRRFAS